MEMRRFLLINALFAVFLLTGCNKNVSRNDSNNESIISSETSGDSISESESETKSDIGFNKDEINIVKGKQAYYDVVVVFPSTYSDEEKEGVWSIDDTSVATVKYENMGGVIGVNSGNTILRFTTNIGKQVATCRVYVYDSESEIQKSYVKVKDADSIKQGDQIIFGCPELNVAASIDSLNTSYIGVESVSYSSDKEKVVSFDADKVATYYVGGDSPEQLTLENQNLDYLCAKVTNYDYRLYYLDNNKGQIHWFFEIPEGYNSIYCVNADIMEDNYCPMFNNDGSKFGLYSADKTDSNHLPTIYRLTVIH